MPSPDSHTEECYVLPRIPYRDGDIEKLRKVAHGSAEFDARNAHADFNGRHVSVNWLPYAIQGPRWSATYTWSGLVWLGSGSLETALKAALAEYGSGARGGFVTVLLDERADMPIADQRRLCEKYDFVAAPSASRREIFAFVEELGKKASSDDASGSPKRNRVPRP